MALRLLEELNGGASGPFRRWLDRLDREPRIAWYPSAGTDFRDLMYLSPRVAEAFPSAGPEPPPPDLFLHTDYYPWSATGPLPAGPVLHEDRHTRVSVRDLEELPRCDLPLDPELVRFPEGSDLTGRAFFLWIALRSDRLGEITAPVLYVFAENTAFWAERLLPAGARLSHLIRVRYGGGFGGSAASGVWILHTLAALGVEVFITDGHDQIQSGDAYALSRYPALRALPPPLLGPPLRVVPGYLWSNHGDVSWHRLHTPASHPRALGSSRRPELSSR